MLEFLTTTDFTGTPVRATLTSLGVLVLVLVTIYGVAWVVRRLRR